MEAMMMDVVHPARNVTIADLQSWLGPVGFLPPECNDDESEDFKVDLKLHWPNKHNGCLQHCDCYKM